MALKPVARGALRGAGQEMSLLAGKGIGTRSALIFYQGRALRGERNLPRDVQAMPYEVAMKSKDIKGKRIPNEIVKVI
jgi:hypothetical protein